MSAQKNKNKNQNDVGTTDHSWDGIEELNNPLPRWWLWFFYACIIFSVIWMILYPAIPLVNSATQGVLGYDSRENVTNDIAMVNAQNASLDEALIGADYETILSNAELNNYATQGGGAIFRTYCSQCHGSGAAGAVGYPNLLDNDWLWGGTFDEIEYTVTHGIRDEAAPDTRSGEMIAFGEVLSHEEIDEVANYVLSLSNRAHEEELAAKGASIFEDNCVSCHLEGGTGDHGQGSANLTDAIWLHGESYDDIVTSITNGRADAMPHWSERLTPSQIKQVTVYVHQLGGGE